MAEIYNDTLGWCCATLELGEFPFDDDDAPSQEEVEAAIEASIKQGRYDHDNVGMIVATVRADEQEIAGKALVHAGFTVLSSFLNSNDKPVLLFGKNIRPEPAPDWAVPKVKTPVVQKGTVRGEKNIQHRRQRIHPLLRSV